MFDLFIKTVVTVALKTIEATVDGLFEGSNAETAKSRARKIAEVFYYKIESERGNEPQNFSPTAG